MNYETMDWDAEAKRVAKAFNIESECMFLEFVDSLERPLVHVDWQSGEDTSVLLPNGHRLFVKYDYNEYSYGVRGVSGTIISIDDDGSPVGRTQNLNPVHVQVLCKGLFHLGLLTHSVESLLKTSISQHQKLEWTLEYEARYK